MKYPQFQGKNLIRGTYQTYFDPVDDDGVHLSDKRIAEHKAKVNARHDAMLQKNLEETLGPLSDEERELFGFAPAPKPTQESNAPHARPANVAKPPIATRRPLSAAATSKPSTLASRNAASILSNASNVTASMRANARSRSALSTAAPPTTLQPRKKPTLATAPCASNSSSMRHQAATAASRTTLGYGKGRTVGPSVRRPLGQSSGNQQRSVSQPGSAHTRSASAASARPALPQRSRSAWTRHDSDATLVGSHTHLPSYDENDDPEMEMIREMALRNLRLDEGLGGDDWFSRAQAGLSTFDIGDEEEFQFTIPEL
ncbi:hypothetical protein B0J12DRAFT_238209 [Macrophomina phaseolina]|uniref:Uncharacterized protein n=1 Tax=Macrophomina phaseolina TaxID=35725 RepID=A0ABQ8GQI3_9PEZI|nr:hypothetical protein B0J12DRAFT_238209 [Macrophomina phaseolina]